MLEISESLFSFLASQGYFTNMMNDSEGNTKLFPVVADDSTQFPFATFRVSMVTGQTKDLTGSLITVYFWFKQNEYRKCVEFTDAMKPIIEEEYDWVSSTVEFLEENQSFAGIITFNT